MGSPRERRHARTAQAILDAALEIITERGVEELSMREIARRIEYSPSGLYEYFAGKDEIIEALCTQGFAQLATQMREKVKGRTAMQRLVESGTAYLEFALHHPRLYLLMFNHVPIEVTATQTMSEIERDAAYTQLKQIIHDGLATGEFVAATGESMEQIAYGTWAQVHGLAMLRMTLLYHAEQDIDALNRQVIQITAEHLRSH